MLKIEEIIEEIRRDERTRIVKYLREQAVLYYGALDKDDEAKYYEFIADLIEQGEYNQQ